MEDRLNDAKTGWQQVRFSDWYSEKNKPMEIATGTALWYRAGKPLVPIRWVLARGPEGELGPMAIACTGLEMGAVQIVEQYLKRWQVEVAFEEARAHLGAGAQRQWPGLSTLRSAPCLMALFSIVTIWANHLEPLQKLTTFQTAWYFKPYPAFSDAVASIRYRTWQFQLSLHSSKNTECDIGPQIFNDHLAFMAARAA